MRGRRIGSWELLEELASGGAGTVWRARDPNGREAALKLINEGDAPNASRRTRFQRELQALGRLHHPHVLQVLDGGLSEGGVPFLALELVPGESLEWRLARQGRLPIREAVAIARKLALALAHAHERGVLHRDVKPDNVLLRPDGDPVLADFGLTRDLRSTPEQGLTVEGRSLGTPGYWAPEQARGQLELVGPASDLYGLGATLHAMLTGAPPHGSLSNLSEALMVVDRPPPPPSSRRPEVDSALDAICLRCLAIDPDRRPPDAQCLADDLARWEREATDQPAGRRSRTPLVAALVLLLGVGAALGVGWQRAAARRGQAEAAARRALAHARAGDPDAADRELRIARELDPHCLEANAAEAYLRLLGREWTRARELTDHTLARDPESFTALAVRACARWRLGDAEGAAQDVERALALAPEDALVQNVHGILLRDRRDVPGAAVAYDRAIELDPRYVWALGNRVMLRCDLGQLDAATRDAEQAVALAPRLAFAWLARARALQAKGDTAGALADLERACALDPREPGCWSARAHALFMSADQDGALAAYERALDLDPDFVEALLGRSVLRQARGELRAARADLERVLVLAPYVVNAWNNLALLRQREGDLEGAAADLDRAIELGPDDMQLRCNRAAIRRLRGDLDGALLDCEHVLSRQPLHVTALLERGVVHARRGDRRAAVADWSAALERMPPEDPQRAVVQSWLKGRTTPR